MKIYLVFIVFMFQWSYAQNDSIYNIGKKLINENKLEEAKLFFENNLKKTNNDAFKIRLFLGLGDVYKSELNNFEANKYYTKGFNLSKKTKNVQLEFLYYVKMGEFFRRRHFISEFEKELEKASELLKKHKIEDKYLTKYYNRKAALFTEFYNNNDSTLVYANKSLELAKKINDKDIYFYSTLEIAGVYERRKEYKTSIKYIESILDYSKQNNMIQHHSDAYVSYIMALLRDDQSEKALKAALNAKEHAKENKLLIDENHFNRYIYQIYLDFKNYEKSHEYLTYINDVSYKLNQIQTDKALLDLETKYKSKEKDNQIKINNLEIESKNKELITTKAKFSLILGLFFLAVISTILIAYFLKKTRQNNKELQLLSMQNEFLVSETNHRVNNNLQLIAVLIENKIRKNKNENEKDEFTRLLTKVEAIAALHRHLYVTNNVSIINLQEYLMDIKNNLEELVLEENINLNVTIEDIKIHSDIALYLGLLVTELFINSIKHAFNEYQQKLISFSLIVKESELFFNYEDNGENSKNIELKPALVEQLCLQLEVDYTINTNHGFHLNFIKKLF